MRRVAVLCPTRGRPGRFAKMVESAIKHPGVDVLAYVDEDDPEVGAYLRQQSSRVTIHVGERIHPGPSTNVLVKGHPEYGYFTLMTDDSTYRDLEVIDRAIMQLDWWDGIGVVHFDYGKVKCVNFPILARRMVGKLGYFANPICTWYCYDTTLQTLGEALGRIERLGDSAIFHDEVPNTLKRDRYQHDFGMALMYYAFRFAGDLERLRAAIKENPEAKPISEVAYA